VQVREREREKCREQMTDQRRRKQRIDIKVQNRVQAGGVNQ
jgi:hypothetical protein